MLPCSDGLFFIDFLEIYIGLLFIYLLILVLLMARLLISTFSILVLTFLLLSFDSHVGFWHSWTSRCTLGYPWSSHLCSTTTEFGWPGLQRWSWKYLQTLIQSAMSGIRKEVELHMDFMGTEHVEHKTDHQLQRKMVRFWKCCYPPWKSNLLCWRYRTWIWSCILSVEQDEEPSWLVG